MSLKKRSREEGAELESLEKDSFEVLPNDLLSYLLSFSFRDYARISRVCHRFRFITRQKGFWRCVGLYGLKNIVPAHILKEVDFFYDLKPEDPPWGWLGSLICSNATRVCKQGFILTYFQDLRSVQKRTLKVKQQNKGKGYVIILAQLNLVFGYIDLKPIHSIYVAHDLLRKVVSLKINNSFIITYVEIWDPKTQKTWYGEPGIVKFEANPYLLYPNKDSFGIWI